MRSPDIHLAAAVALIALVPPLTASFKKEESKLQMLRLLTRY